MCGTSRLADAQMAVSLGVDALGFIFVEKSPRYITPEFARSITKELPPFLCKVGVFVNEELHEIEEIVDYLGLNAIQLHGQEEPSFCKHLSDIAPSCHIIKAFRVGLQTRAEELSVYNDHVHGILLDTYVKGQEGGTGLVFDWKILDELHLQKPLILAGGLDPENILMALETVMPFGIDVNSGVEISPGIKSEEKLRNFVEQVQKFTESSW